MSALLGRIPSAVGYQPTLATDLGGLQERITSTAKGSITSVQVRGVEVANRTRRDHLGEQLAPNPSHTTVARTARCTNVVKAWALSIVKGPFSIVPNPIRPTRNRQITVSGERRSRERARDTQTIHVDA